MAIFSRRDLQRMINANSCFLGPAATTTHVSRLNAGTPDSIISTEWEIAVLHGLSRLGRVNHEPEMIGPARLDVVFTSADDPSLRFSGDVVAVTDFGVEELTSIRK